MEPLGLLLPRRRLLVRADERVGDRARPSARTRDGWIVPGTAIGSGPTRPSALRTVQPA